MAARPWPAGVPRSSSLTPLSASASARLSLPPFALAPDEVACTGLCGRYPAPTSGTGHRRQQRGCRGAFKTALPAPYEARLPRTQPHYEVCCAPGREPTSRCWMLAAVRSHAGLRASLLRPSDPAERAARLSRRVSSPLGRFSAKGLGRGVHTRRDGMARKRPNFCIRACVKDACESVLGIDCRGGGASAPCKSGGSVTDGFFPQRHLLGPWRTLRGAWRPDCGSGSSSELQGPSWVHAKMVTGSWYFAHVESSKHV
eukprot:358851-Chlamydomonas_euryale.AAC.3